MRAYASVNLAMASSNLVKFLAHQPSDFVDRQCEKQNN